MMKTTLNKIKLSLIALMMVNPLLAADKEGGATTKTLEIRRVSSGVNYPTKGDEAVAVKHGKTRYHAKILHPKITEGPHFSVPFFWSTGPQEQDMFGNLVTLKTHVGGLDWWSLNKVFFFAEKKGPLRGFWLENGFDNWDNGSAGLIVLFQEDKPSLKPSVWKWHYARDPNKPKGNYSITQAENPDKQPSAKLFQQLEEIMKFAETKAEGWQGP